MGLVWETFLCSIEQRNFSKTDKGMDLTIVGEFQDPVSDLVTDISYPDDSTIRFVIAVLILDRQELPVQFEVILNAINPQNGHIELGNLDGPIIFENDQEESMFLIPQPLSTNIQTILFPTSDYRLMISFRDLDDQYLFIKGKVTIGLITS